MAKSQRISISGRNLQYLQDLAEQMDEPNLGAVMTYLLTDIRGLGYKFGDKPASQPQPQQQPQTPIGYTFDSTTFEPAFQPLHEQNHTNHQADETILRLASLIENF